MRPFIFKVCSSQWNLSQDSTVFLLSLDKPCDDTGPMWTGMALSSHLKAPSSSSRKSHHGQAWVAFFLPTIVSSFWIENPLLCFKGSEPTLSIPWEATQSHYFLLQTQGGQFPPPPQAHTHARPATCILYSKWLVFRNITPTRPWVMMSYSSLQLRKPNRKSLWGRKFNVLF